MSNIAKMQEHIQDQGSTPYKVRVQQLDLDRLDKVVGGSNDDPARSRDNPTPLGSSIMFYVKFHF